MAYSQESGLGLLPVAVAAAPTVASGVVTVGGKIIGAISGLFGGGRSKYTFSPGHPPGAFRGKAAMQDYQRRMAALTVARGADARDISKGPGGIQANVFGGISPILGIALGLGLLLAIARRK